MKILYVEDCLDLGECVKSIMELMGHEVVWFQSRAELPESFIGYDLVVSDFNVPGGEFQDTKRRCDTMGIPLLLLSGNPDAADQHENFIPKPFGRAVLTEKISQLSVLCREAK